jgi:hypothetical protein
MADADLLDFVLSNFGLGVWVTHRERIVDRGIATEVVPPAAARFGTDRCQLPLSELPEGLLARAARVWLEAAPDEDKEYLRKQLGHFL